MRKLYVQRVRNDLEVWAHECDADENHPAGLCIRNLKQMDGVGSRRWSQPCPHGIVVVTNNVPDDLLSAAMRYYDAEPM